MANNPYAQYERNKIMTATPAELTLMLYEGAIKFGNIAIKAIEEGDTQKAHINIVKVEKIIDEFRRTLDFKYPVAQDFENIYSYLSKRLVEANMKSIPEKVTECMDIIKELRSAWAQAMIKARKEKGAS